MNVTGTIRDRIEAMPPGEVFTPAAFLPVGTRAAVDQALSRLARAGAIARVGRGVYARPKQSRFAGAVLPEPQRIARAVAEAAGAKLQVHGAEAARRLGLTTQMPTRPVFYTTGPSRRLRAGKLEIELKHASSRKLLLSERPAGLAVTALWYLGRRAVTPAVVRTLRGALPESEFAALREHSSGLPAWMIEALHHPELPESGA